MLHRDGTVGRMGFLLTGAFFFASILGWAPLQIFMVEATTTISQLDFEFGSYVISHSGDYFVTEDIEFMPNGHLGLDVSRPEDYLFPTELQMTSGVYSSNAFNLGFFAAIVIATENVTLDLGGHRILQSVEHSLMQRFFALIEIGSAPFPPGEGPELFSHHGEFFAPKNITIKNGILGRSSHHSIHGNQCENVTLKDLTLEDFEVAGISLNTAKNVRIVDVDIINSRIDVPVSGRFSHAIYALRTATARVTLNTAMSSYSALQSAIASLRSHVVPVIQAVSNNQQVTTPLYRSLTQGLPDGSMLAGIILHPKVHVGHFLTDSEHSYDTVDLIMENIFMANLSVAPIEIAAIQLKESAEDGYSRAHVRDNAGAVFDIDSIRDPDTEAYVPNPLADMQVALARYGIECKHANCSSASDLAVLSRNTIRRKVIDWVDGIVDFAEMIENDNYFVASDHDYMFHFNKGVFGVKIDGAASVEMNNVVVDRLENHATPQQRSIFFPTKGGYFGYGARAVAISTSVYVKGSVVASNTYSAYGVDSLAIDLRNNASEIDVNMEKSLLPIANGVFAGALSPNDPIFERSGCPFASTAPPSATENENELRTYRIIAFTLIGTQMVTFLALISLRAFQPNQPSTAIDKKPGSHPEDKC